MYSLNKICIGGDTTQKRGRKNEKMGIYRQSHFAIGRLQ